MHNTVSIWLDVAILVLVLGMAVTNITPLLVEASKPIVKDYEDKTALKSYGDTYTESRVKTGADLVASLLNLDENIPYPRSIRVNNLPIIDLDNAFITNKQPNISAIYSKYGDFKLSTMLEWTITKIEFVYDPVNGDYWHYVLVE